jgi:hypothetical protein
LKLLVTLDQRESGPVGHGRDEVNAVFACKVEDGFSKIPRFLSGDRVLEAATAVPGKGSRGEGSSVRTYGDPMASPA